MTSAPAIGFEYFPSRWPARMSVLMGALATLAVLCCALTVWIKLSLIVAIMLGLWHATRVGSMPMVTAVGLSGDDDWSLRLKDGEDVLAKLASFRTFGALVLLRLLTEEQGAQVLLLAPDNTDDDTRRRLRMRLAAMPPEGETARR